jgi:hypothetical protein
MLLRPALSPADVAADNLLKTRAQYYLFHTIHCVYREIENAPAEGLVNAQSTCEYWADGDKYRIVDRPDDPLKMPGMTEDVRWDGGQFQRFEIQHSVLWTSTRPSQSLIYVSLPQPLVPFMFLCEGAENGYLRITLSRLLRDETRLRFEGVKATNADGTEADCPGGHIFGFDSKYHISFGGVPAFLPTKIARVLSNGVVVGEVEITYVSVPCGEKSVYFPQSIKEIGRDENSVLAESDTDSMTQIELDKPIAPQTFTPLATHLARTLINLDKPPYTPAGDSTQPSSAANKASPVRSDAIQPITTATTPAPTAAVTADDSSAQASPIDEWVGSIWKTMIAIGLLLASLGGGYLGYYKLRAGRKS